MTSRALLKAILSGFRTGDLTEAETRRRLAEAGLLPDHISVLIELNWTPAACEIAGKSA